MCNIKALSLLVWKLWQRLKFFKRRSNIKVKVIRSTRHVFVKQECPRRQQSQNMAKIFKSYILTPPRPQGHEMSVKCEEPIDELTVQVWLLYMYHHPNFKYCTLLISRTELRTDRQPKDRQTDGRTDRRTDDPITRCPPQKFQAGDIKIMVPCEKSGHKEYTFAI